MARTGFFTDILKIASNERDVLPIENILLNLRYSALCKHSRAEKRKIVAMSVPFTWVFAIIFLPFTIVASYKTVFLSVLIAYVPFKVFTVISFEQFVLLALIIWVGFKHKSVIQELSKFAFDICDLLTLGWLTEQMIAFYKSTGPERRKEFINPKNSLLVAHLYATRQSYKPLIETMWEDYFSKMSVEFMEDQDIIDAEVEQYWKEIKENTLINLPPSLDGNFYWEHETFWSSVTPACLKKATSKLETIEETRNGKSILSSALMYGCDVKIIEFLLDLGADPNGSRIGYRRRVISNLALGVEYCSANVVHLLLERGALVRPQSELGEFKNPNNPELGRRSTLNILQLSAIRPKDCQSFSLILRACEDRTMEVTNDGYSLLHLAVQSSTDQSEAIRELIENGIDVNDQNNSEKTTPVMAYFKEPHAPIHYMWQGANLQNLKTLMAQGADPKLLDVNDQNVNHWLSTRQLDKGFRKKINEILSAK